MIPCEAFWHMDTTNCNLSKIGSKIIAIRFCKTWNRILKACIALKPEGDEKWKPRNSINSDKLCVTSTRHFWKNVQKMKISKFSNLRFLQFFLFKSMNSIKNPQNSILCTLWHNFIQITGNGNNYLNLPINLNIMRYFFGEYIITKHGCELHLYDLFALVGGWSSVYIRKNMTNHPISSKINPSTTANKQIHCLKRILYTLFKMCVPLIPQFLKLVWSLCRNRFNHSSWIAIISSTDHPKSVYNRFVKFLVAFVCCGFSFWIFCWYRDFIP